MSSKIENILNSIPIAIVVLEVDTTHVSYLNNSAMQLFEIDNSSMESIDFSKFFVDKVDLLDLLVNVDINNQINDVELCMIKSKSKENIWVKTAAQKGLYEGVNTTFLTFHDYTADKSLELELKESRKKAETASFAKSAFLANMSHEIRTPMNSIIGFSEILAKRLQDPRNQEYINSVVKSGRALLDLINDVLDYSKIEAGRFKLNNNSTNLYRMVSDVYELFYYDAEIKGLKFSFSYPPNFPLFFTVDETRLKQVLINLVSNSIKFTHEGQIKLNVELNKIDDIKYEASFIISDTGIGVDKKQQEKIFEAFAQQEFHDTKKYGGSGLGLSIAGNLVKLMGGQLSLESELGKGSTFKFTIPVSRGNENNDQQVVESIPKNAVANIVFDQSSILVIDNDIELMAIINGFLKGRSLSVYEALSVEDGFALALKTLPKVILIGMQVSEMDGIEILERIREDEKLKNIKVVAVVDATTHYQMRDFNTVQFDDYIKKPIQEYELLNVLVKFINYKNKSSSLVSDTVIEDIKFSDESRDIIKENCGELYEKCIERKSNNNIRNLATCLQKAGDNSQLKDIKDLGVMLENAQQIYDMDRIDKVFDLLSQIMDQ